MPIVFLGDDHHRYFQEKQVETLASRLSELEVLYWSTAGLDVFTNLDRLSENGKLTLIASRHGAIPAVHWTARNREKVKRQILLHPSLHLNIPGLEAPSPHFISTMVICHSKVVSPSHEEISTLAGKLFHDYSVHLTTEPAELSSTLSLLSLA
jgi:hypothetical protein